MINELDNPDEVSVNFLKVTELNLSARLDMKDPWFLSRGATSPHPATDVVLCTGTGG